MPEITMYATSWCGFCAMARRLLESKGQRWEEIDVDAIAGSRDEMIERSGRRTVPQIWIGDRHVGGYDDLAALESAGELDALLSEA
ncbi:MAG: glutaredoxin 3 [Myxococcota bacterium]